MQQVVIGGVNLIFTMIAIRTVDRWGRRPLMILGPSGMGVALLGMAAAAYWGQTGAGDWSTGAAVLMLAFILTYIACVRAVDRAGGVGDAGGDVPDADPRPGDGAVPRCACGWPTSWSR